MRWSWNQARRRHRAPRPDATRRRAADDRAQVTGSTDVAGRFRTAWADGHGDTAVPELLPTRLARACVAVLPVGGAGLSLLEKDFRVPLGASDTTAQAAERLQFTQGEGPCLSAGYSGRIVAARAHDIEQQWPAFAEQLFARTPFRSVMSLRLPLAGRTIAALDLYLLDDEQLHAVRFAEVAIVSDQIVRVLKVAQAIAGSRRDQPEVPDPRWLTGPSARNRTNVWVAMGMLMGAGDVSAPDALARLRGYAYSHDLDLDQLAAQLLAGAIRVEQITP